MGKEILGKKNIRCFNGNIQISIKCYHNSFEITVNFSEISKKGTQLKEKNDKIHVNLVTLKGFDEKKSITRTISYKRDSDGNIKPMKITIKYDKNSLVKGSIIISPELYLTLGMLKHAQTTQNMKKYFPIGIHQKYSPSISKFIPYTHMKVNQPYRG